MEPNDNFLHANNSEKYRAIDDLFEDSRPSKRYYTLLILSSVIISAGVLLGNTAILIGGMLVTPVLTPILLIALALMTSHFTILRKTTDLIIKSIGVIFVVSVIMGFIFHIPENSDFFRSTIFDDSLRSALLYFIVAVVSGVAATFAWIHKKLNTLPGISIAVSLVPPLSMVGIWLSAGELQLMRYTLFVFVFNFIGIMIGSIVVFSILRFNAVDTVVRTKLESEEKEAEAKEAEKEKKDILEEIEDEIEEEIDQQKAGVPEDIIIGMKK